MRLANVKLEDLEVRGFNPAASQGVDSLIMGTVS